jgi:hypothetical protein
VGVGDVNTEIDVHVQRDDNAGRNGGEDNVLVVIGISPLKSVPSHDQRSFSSLVTSLIAAVLLYSAVKRPV